ncbi:unnamed protein product, partial [Prorocentrum cordatum]
LGLGKHVGDIAVRAQGNARQVVDDMADGAQWFARAVESTLQLEVSVDPGEVPGKSAGLGTSAWVGHAPGRRLARLGIHMEQQASQLGIDRKSWKGRGLEAARARRRLSSRRPARDRPQRAGRFRVLAERRRLVVKAKRWGARVLLVSKVGLLAAGTYGHRAIGLTPQEVAQLRSTVNAALPGRSRHRSTTLRPACFGEDPGPTLASAPIAAWAEQAWDHPGLSPTMSEAWKRQQIRLLHDESQSAQMVPASSCALAARRSGWTWPSRRTFVSREGHVIDMAAVRPRDVQAMAERDADLQQLEAWVAEDNGRAALGPASFSEALQKWFRRWQRRWCARCCPERLRWGVDAEQGFASRSRDVALAQALEEHWEGEDCYLAEDVGTDGSLKGLSLMEWPLASGGAPPRVARTQACGDKHGRGSAAAAATLECEQQRISQVNRAADERAGRGAECGTDVMLQYVDEACNAAAAKIHNALKYQAELTTRVLDEHFRRPDIQELPKSRQGARPSIQLVPDTAQAHDIRRRPGAADECCRGHVAASLPIVFTTAGAVSDGHRLWRTSTWIWCRRCGQHAQRRLAGLRGECLGRPGQPRRLVNLRAGKEPNAHVADPPVLVIMTIIILIKGTIARIVLDVVVVTLPRRTPGMAMAGAIHGQLCLATAVPAHSPKYRSDMGLPFMLRVLLL